MKRCLIWGTGTYFNDNIHLLQYYEQCGQIKIIGVTSNESFYNSILGYSFIEKCNIDVNEFDVVIVMSHRKNFSAIKRNAILRGIDAEKIVPIYVMSLPKFDFDKYMSILKNTPTIFTPNCWGGITYNSLGLEIKSPLINMFMQHTDYFKFLRNPKYYLDCPLKFERMRLITESNTQYPIAKCNDILLHFNHSTSYEEALSCWNRRKERINWDNIMVMFYDENRDLINEFYELPYEKKICFTPYNLDKTNHVCMDRIIKSCNIPLWEAVNSTARGRYFYYDVFDLLLYNKITPIAEIKS